LRLPFIHKTLNMAIGHLLINGELKTPTLADLKRLYPKIDFRRVLEFEHMNRKPDPDNPGRMLNPTHMAPTGVTAVVDDRAAEIQYYRSTVKGTKDRPTRYTPTSIAIKGVFQVDLRNPQKADYALAMLMLIHPQLVQKFRLKDRSLEAKQNLERDQDVIRAEGMLKDPEHSAYIKDDQLENIMLAVGMTPTPGLTSWEYREQLVGYVRRFAKDFLYKIGGERLRIQSLVSDATATLMLDYNAKTGEYRFVRIVDDGDRIVKQADTDAFFTVPRTRLHEHEAVLVEHLAHPTNGLDRDILRDNMQELKRRQTAQVAATPTVHVGGAKDAAKKKAKRAQAVTETVGELGEQLGED